MSGMYGLTPEDYERARSEASGVSGMNQENPQYAKAQRAHARRVKRNETKRVLTKIGMGVLVVIGLWWALKSGFGSGLSFPEVPGLQE